MDPAFIIYGVAPNAPGVVTGITEQYDDASLQQLVASYVEPIIEFVFYDDIDGRDGKRIAVLHVASSSKPFHVVTKDIGGLRDGTSFIRQGSSTRGVHRADWMRLCLGRDSDYLAQALQMYGQHAALMKAQANLVAASGNEIERLKRQMAAIAGLPPGSLG